MKKLILGVLFAGLTAACSSNNDNNDNRSEGALSLAVTDAPVDQAEAVVITFTGIELLRNGSDEPRHSITLDEPRTIDLLQLQGSNSEFLVQGEVVPSGVYDEVRLLMDMENASCQNVATPFGSYITIDGTDYPLVVPSGGASGFKVKGPITVAAGGTGSYTVDFDLRRSIAERGATSCYNLRPVQRVVDNAQVGTLTGTVDGDLLLAPACTADSVSGSGAAVYVYTGSDVTPSDASNDETSGPLTSALLVPLDDDSGDFSYEVGFLLAGEYTAAFTCQAGDDDPEAEDEIVFGPGANVTITADQTTTQDFELVPVP